MEQEKDCLRIGTKDGSGLPRPVFSDDEIQEFFADDESPEAKRYMEIFEEGRRRS